MAAGNSAEQNQLVAGSMNSDNTAAEIVGMMAVVGTLAVVGMVAVVGIVTVVDIVTVVGIVAVAVPGTLMVVGMVVEVAEAVAEAVAVPFDFGCQKDCLLALIRTAARSRVIV
jgi:hypothetical protein